MSAMPIGVPGWPEFAFCTASTARKRIVLTQSSSSLSFDPIFGSLLSSATAIAVAPSFAALVLVTRHSWGLGPEAWGLRSAGLYSSQIHGPSNAPMSVDESVTVKGSPVRSLQKFIEA